MSLRLQSFRLPFWVDVDVRDYDGRWVAVAELAGEQELELGWDARTALEDALSSLGVRRCALVESAVSLLTEF